MKSRFSAWRSLPRASSRTTCFRRFATGRGLPPSCREEVGVQVRQETGAQCLPQRPHGHQPTEPACPLPLPPREWPVGGGNPASPPHAPCTLPGPPLPRVWAVEQSQPPGRREEGVQATTSLPSAAPRSPKGAILMCLHLSSATSSRDIHQPPIRGRYLCQALGDHHSGETPPEAGRRPCVLSSTGRGRSGACRVQVWFATTLSWPWRQRWPPSDLSAH